MKEETEFEKRDRLFKLANSPEFSLAIMVAEDGNHHYKEIHSELLGIG
jgi:hypothetical protein